MSYWPVGEYNDEYNDEYDDEYDDNDKNFSNYLHLVGFSVHFHLIK